MVFPLNFHSFKQANKQTNKQTKTMTQYPERTIGLELSIFLLLGKNHQKKIGFRIPDYPSVRKYWTDLRYDYMFLQNPECKITFLESGLKLSADFNLYFP